MIEVFNMPQGSDEWYQARLGIITASEFATVMREGRTKGSPSVTRREYMLKLMGERLTGDPMYRWKNDHMDRGHEQEPDARNLYAFQTDLEPTPIGFIRNGYKGCSPDSLVETNGMVEIKSKLAHLHLDVLLGNAVPNEHVAQIQGQLWVAEREWCDFVSYCPKLPLFVKRVYRDDAFIEKLSKAVDLFERELVTLMEVIEPTRSAA